MTMLTDEQRIALLPKVMQKGKEPVTQVWLTQGDALSYSERIESAACADRDARIAELERELAEVRKDAERWRFASWHIGLAWGEEGFTSLVRIVSDKHRALINEQVDMLMAGKMPKTRAAMKGQQ